MIASMSGEIDFVYVDGVDEGYVTDRAGDVEAIADRYEAIRSLALPMPTSLDLKTKVVEDKWMET